ncbi:hypothetical protein WM40_02545 [Robbsia andropogonis]|uniref:Uncharacterized protein n=1 Tax=Robbsia andropogonis TaxID=28092 RepID=A0A0F5K5T4_9BURK|nr:hypothetical protein WM40_02545 [Robbsia andropogonis]
MREHARANRAISRQNDMAESGMLQPGRSNARVDPDAPSAYQLQAAVDRGGHRNRWVPLRSTLVHITAPEAGRWAPRNLESPIQQGYA